MGESVELTHGLYSGPATVTQDVLRDGVAIITGSTNLAYVLTSDDLGASITFEEVANNGVDPPVRTRTNAIGPIQDSAPPPPPSPYYINTTQVYINSTVVVGSTPNNDQFAEILEDVAGFHTLLAAEAARRNQTL